MTEAQQLAHTLGVVVGAASCCEQVTDERVNSTGNSGTNPTADGGILENRQLTPNDLTQAQLTKAHLTKAHLTKARLTKAQVTKDQVTKDQVTKAQLTKGIANTIYLIFIQQKA